MHCSHYIHFFALCPASSDPTISTLFIKSWFVLFHIIVTKTFFLAETFIQVFQIFKPVWDFTLILLFDFIYQYMISLIVCFPIRRRWSVVMWDHHKLDIWETSWTWTNGRLLRLICECRNYREFIDPLKEGPVPQFIKVFTETHHNVRFPYCFMI
jgi:hypothetical protein